MTRSLGRLRSSRLACVELDRAAELGLAFEGSVVGPSWSLLMSYSGCIDEAFINRDETILWQQSSINEQTESYAMVLV